MAEELNEKGIYTSKIVTEGEADPDNGENPEGDDSTENTEKADIENKEKVWPI